MLSSFAFAAPWLLLGLMALPLLWWLLRAVPPAPRLIPFPAIRLLFGLEQTEETPHRTPWWLLALRLILAAALIIGLAHPLLNPGAALDGDGPLVLIIDDDWAAAQSWDDVQAMTADLIDQAERQSLPVLVLSTAPGINGEAPQIDGLTRAADARRRVQALAPKPWSADYTGAAEALAVFAPNFDNEGTANIYWLASGIAAEGSNGSDFVDTLGRWGDVHLVTPPDYALATILERPSIQPGRVTIGARRAGSLAASTKVIQALGEDGRILAQLNLQFDAGETRAETAIELPAEMRNAIARFSVEGDTSAASVILIDEQFRRRPVGIISGSGAEQDQTLVGDRYYLDRALTPYAELRDGSVRELLARQLAVMILADVGTLTDEETENLSTWLDQGGVLVRFAGPRLAEGGDTLLPTILRQGGRTFGGIMSWADPLTLAPFDATSPFAGLAIQDDVTVTRQVLAEPGPELAGKTWARLVDGTPLITAERKGAGWLILFHTTANTTWSNLALSGLYVDMLRRILGLSQGVADVSGDLALAPLLSLDGFGRFNEPSPIATSILSSQFSQAQIGPATPPGYYGTDLARRALNLGPSLGAVTSLFGASNADLPDGVIAESFAQVREVDLKPWFLTAALLLLLADFVIGLVLRGLMPTPRRQSGGRAATSLAIAFILLAAPALAPRSWAQELSGDPEQFAIEAAGAVRLGYIVTGIAEADAISKDGLTGLSAILNARTSIEPAPPAGLDPATDELAFFSFIYWRIVPGQADLSGIALERINQYLRNGGMILFDTADQQFSSGGTGSPGVARLRELVGNLDIPSLQPVPETHVLTKSFYLLQDFPGRWVGGELWVQRPNEHINDGVSPVIVGSNDFAAAWATDAIGRARYPVSPGGERQREMALRFGVNLIMYSLTGNYKADQVHIPAILDRLGQ